MLLSVRPIVKIRVMPSHSLSPKVAVIRLLAERTKKRSVDRFAPLAEMVVRTPQPFVQTIVDVEVPRMVFGRVCLIGDAAFTARPHAAAGTATAAENGWTPAASLMDTEGDVDAALRAWESVHLELGRNLVARAREVGERSQFHGSWVPGDPDLRFDLYGPGR